MPPASRKSKATVVATTVSNPSSLILPPVPQPRQMVPALGSAAGRKRKLDDKNLQKYYAVRAGVRPGIYLTWHECQAQIAGFKGAQYKSFVSREDAAAFVAGLNPEGGAKDKGEPRFYAVAVGNYPGIYTDWTEASKAIVGAKGPKYKKFSTRADAANFIRMYANADTRQALSGGGRGSGAAGSGAQATAANAEEDDDDDDEDDDEDDEEDEDEEDAGQLLQSTTKRARLNNVAGAGTSTSATAMLNIYTDGSSLGNGQSGASAGIGVFFGHGDKRNISERLKGEVQTNQRAELTAILRALQVVPVSQPVRIFSDSTYAISCVNDWYKSWSNNGWRTRGGDSVMNQDLIKAVRSFIDMRDKAGAMTMFRWVKGHSSDSGNVAADMLANQGARLRS
ncbi:ribonuclease [Niveomyces insectorum RCEF 264]|uniref:ribonuclease H n=1 Tax=Niveomyces insectorum RCEF 264 TaxID=1081102 RepID=A0A167ZRT2_9HYPO|nr:ribonuclease [Niveomyces insectorum RCEF 264]